MKDSIKGHQDAVAEKLDEMADLAEHWKRNRNNGRNPTGIRLAMLTLAHEVIAAAEKPGQPENPVLIHEEAEFAEAERQIQTGGF